jgi:hypothetical protein
LLPINTFEIENGHNFFTEVVVVDILDNMLPDTGNLGDLENVRALVVILIEQGSNEHFQAGVYALGKWLERRLNNLLEHTVD